MYSQYCLKKFPISHGSLHPCYVTAPNDTELSRCDRGSEAAEGAVGWDK